MEKTAKIYIAGHRGMVGSALVRKFTSLGYTNLICKTRKELDLLDQPAVADFFDTEKPEYVFLAAAKVGGILANNTYPADFLYENLQIQNNIIQQSYLHGVKKLLFLGSSCIYPRECPQPMKEEYLLTGSLEPTNEPYAIAKIAGIKLCQSYNRQYGTNFIAVMPTNLYGPGDNYDSETSHLFASCIRKFAEAGGTDNTITMWGSGTPKREFLHVDDMAEACMFLMRNFTPTEEQNKHGDIFFNVGTGEDISVQDLARTMGDVLNISNTIEWDNTKPDGTPRKLLDVSRLTDLGWKSSVGLKEGIELTYEYYTNQRAVDN